MSHTSRLITQAMTHVPQVPLHLAAEPAQPSDGSQLVGLSRSVTFFRLVDAMAASLKGTPIKLMLKKLTACFTGIFVPFFGHLLDAIILHLNAPPVSSEPDTAQSATPPPKKRR